MDNFLTWDILKDYITFVGIVFSIVAFTKNLPLIKLIPTKIWSVIVSFSLLLSINLHDGTFAMWDLLLYFINALMISYGANGIADTNGGDQK